MKIDNSGEMPSLMIDVVSCNDQQRWEFLSCTTIIKPKHYFPNGKCVYCELEAMKEREAKLRAQLEKVIRQRDEWRHKYASTTKTNTYAEMIKQNEDIEGDGK